MPIYEYRCQQCGAVTEHLVRPQEATPTSVGCEDCGSQDTIRIISQVNFKTYKKSKYSEEFMEKSLPFLKSRKELAPQFAEGKGSDEAKAFEVSEKIGEQIDKVIQSALPKQ